MKTRWILSTAVVLTGHLAMGSPLAAPLAGTGMTPPALHRPLPDLMLVQSAEPLIGSRDQMMRLRQNRSIIENALRPPLQAVPAEPVEPRTRALQSPQPMLSAVPQESAAPPEPEPVAETPGQVSCEAAADIVAEYGFSEIRTTDCSGDLYRYSATRDGTAYSIGITAAAGEIADVSRE